MRPLTITSPARQAEHQARTTAAGPLLQTLAAARPLCRTAPDEEALLRFILSVATQYRGRGLSWEALLTAGYSAAAACFARYAGQPEKFEQWRGWWVRQGVVRALENTKSAG